MRLGSKKKFLSLLITSLRNSITLSELQTDCDVCESRCATAAFEVEETLVDT